MKKHCHSKHSLHSSQKNRNHRQKPFKTMQANHQRNKCNFPKSKSTPLSSKFKNIAPDFDLIETLQKEAQYPEFECAIGASSDNQTYPYKERVQILINTTSSDYFCIPQYLTELLDIPVCEQITNCKQRGQAYQYCQIELFFDFSLEALSIEAIVDETIEDCYASYKFFEDIYPLLYSIK